MTVRSFDLVRRQWSIHCISSASGALDPGVVGGFTGDRGEFYGEDEHDGRPWETNWIMELMRAAP
jgi:hypothetical protein